jgi:acylphosphatase
MTVRRKVLVSGDVQGVFFRATCRDEALSRGLTGYVANLPDGRVEAVFEGDERSVTEMVEWSRQGPRLARVTHVDVTDESPEGLEHFKTR